MKPTLKLCSSHSATGISKTPDLVTSLEPVPLLFRARGTTRESLIEGAKQKHTQREGLYDLRIRCRGVVTESDSDDSAVEAIVGNRTTGGDSETVSIATADESKSSLSRPPPATHLDNKLNIPEDNTAQRIMHLLTELGSSNLVHSPSFAERNFLHCPNCTGRLLNV